MRTVPAGVEEADEGGRGVVGDAADPDDGPAGLAALPVLVEAPLQDAAEHRRRRGLARARGNQDEQLSSDDERTRSFAREQSNAPR